MLHNPSRGVCPRAYWTLLPIYEQYAYLRIYTNITIAQRNPKENSVKDFHWKMTKRETKEMRTHTRAMVLRAWHLRTAGQDRDLPAGVAAPVLIKQLETKHTDTYHRITRNSNVNAFNCE